MSPETLASHSRPSVGAFPRSAPSPELADLVSVSCLDAVDRRIEGSFFGSTRYRQFETELGRLRAALLWSGLPAMIRTEGWEFLGLIGFDQRRGDPGPLETVTLRLRAGESIDLPKNARAFLVRGEERLVVWIQEGGMMGETFELSVLGSGDPSRFTERWREVAREHNPLRGRALRADGTLVELDGCPSWDELHLPEVLKESLRTVLHRARLRARNRWGMRRRSGLLLSGPTGTGKTMIGRILAAEAESTFLWATPADVDCSEAIDELFELSRLLSPTILFLEDLDLVAEDRAMVRRSTTLGELMNQLDGPAGDHDLLTIATTNRLDVLETALRNRPGRFDQVLEIPPLEEAQVRAFLERRLAAVRVEGGVLGDAARRLTGRTGAEVEDAIDRILFVAWERENPHHGGGGGVDEEDGGDVEPRVDGAVVEQALGEAQRPGGGGRPGF